MSTSSSSAPSALGSVRLRSPGGRLAAEWVPRAGMLGWSLREDGDELIARPASLAEYVRTGSPTGIALLHPWANRLASPEYEIAGRRVRLDLSAPNVHTDPGGLPIHGLVAGFQHWQLEAEEEARLTGRLDYTAWPELTAGFPFAHVLELSAQLSDERLEITARLTPTGDGPVPVAFGFHPYLRLPRVPRERWWVELPVTSQVVLDDRMLPTGESRPVRIEPGSLGARAFDHHFDGLADPPEFVLAGGDRRLTLRFLEGYRFAQVFAPPGSEFISFEPMTAPIDPFASDRTLLAEPGSSYRARFSISVG